MPEFTIADLAEMSGQSEEHVRYALQSANIEITGDSTSFKKAVEAAMENLNKAQETMKRVALKVPDKRHTTILANGVVKPYKVINPIRNRGDKPKRNEPCPCGSGKKFKNCHLEKRNE